MKFVYWLQEQGYELKGIDTKTNTFIKAKEVSSIVPNACLQYLIKGDSVFIYGLGEVGFPPHLLSPKLPNLQRTEQLISFEVMSSGMIDKMDCKEAFDLLHPLSIQKEWLSNFKN